MNKKKVQVAECPPPHLLSSRFPHTPIILHPDTLSFFMALMQHTARRRQREGSARVEFATNTTHRLKKSTVTRGTQTKRCDRAVDTPPPTPPLSPFPSLPSHPPPILPAMKRASSDAGSTDVRGLSGPDVPAVVAAMLAEDGGIAGADGGGASIPAKRRRLSLRASSASSRPPPPPPPPPPAAAPLLDAACQPQPPPTQPAVVPARTQTPSPEPVRPPRSSHLRQRGRRREQRRGGAKEALPHDFSGVWRGTSHNLGPLFKPGAPTPGFVTPTARERHRRRAEERADAAAAAAADDDDAPPKTLRDIKMRLRDSAAVRDGGPKRRCYGVLGREVMERRLPASNGGGGGGGGSGARFVSQAETAAYYASHKEVTVIGSSSDEEPGHASSDTSSYLSATGAAAAAAAAAAGYDSDDVRLLYDSLSDDEPEAAGETAGGAAVATTTATAAAAAVPRPPPPLIAHRLSDRTEAPRRIQTSRHRCGLYASLVAVPTVPSAAGTLLLTYGGLRRQALARRSCADPTGSGSQCSVPSDPATANTAPSNAASICSVEENAWRPVVFLPAAPAAVYGHALALLALGGGCGTRHEVLVIGGRTAQGRLAAATAQKGLPRLLLDAATLRTTCTVRVDAQPSVRNVALAHHTATVDAARRVVYVVGGVDGAGACTADVSAFDAVSRAWLPTEVVGAAPPRRAHHSAALHAVEGGEEEEAALFVYGGVHTDSAEPSTYHLLSDLYRLDVQRGGGRDGRGLVLFGTKVTGVCGGGVPRGVPAASLGHTMHVVDGVVCVVGGEEGRQWVSDADVRRGSLTLHCYDVARGVWSQRVSPFLRGVRGHSSCRVGGDVYVLGRDVLEGGGGGCGDAAAALLRVALRPTLRDLCAQFVLRNKLVFARPAHVQAQAQVTAAAPSSGTSVVAPSGAGGRRLPTRRRKPSCVGGEGGGA